MAESHIPKGLFWLQILAGHANHQCLLVYNCELWYNEELNDLYSSPNIVRVIKSRRMKWAGHVAQRGRGEAYTGFWWGNLRDRDNLGDTGVWEDNIKMDLQEVGKGCGDWMELTQYRDRWRALVSTVMNFRLPLNVGNFSTSWKPVSFSRRTLFHVVSKCELWCF